MMMYDICKDESHGIFEWILLLTFRIQQIRILTKR